MKLKSKLLIIAGSDSSGGAGIQADIKTATSLGVYAMTAITAITAQNTTGVKSIIPVPPKEIFNQISFSVQDIKPNSVKIGMLHNMGVIKEVIKAIKKYKLKNISEGIYHIAKMQKRNEYMVDKADIVIAVWDGSSGGTGNCVKYAQKVGKSIVKLNPVDIKEWC